MRLAVAEIIAHNDFPLLKITIQRANVDNEIIFLYLSKDGDGSITVVPTPERAFDLETYKICL